MKKETSKKSSSQKRSTKQSKPKRPKADPGIENNLDPASEGENSVHDSVEITEENNRIEQLIQEKQEIQDQMLRNAAEFENYKKRRIAEQERLSTSLTEGLIRDLLPVIDDLDLMIQNANCSGNETAVLDGAKLIREKLFDLLKRRGLEEINAEGQQFDPEFHEALMQQPSEDVEPDTVLMVQQTGYMLKNKLLRPSRVIVSTQVEKKHQE